MVFVGVFLGGGGWTHQSEIVSIQQKSCQKLLNQAFKQCIRLYLDGHRCLQQTGRSSSDLIVTLFPQIKALLNWH